MMMSILSPAARRKRGRGRLWLVVLAVGMTVAGGAWAAGRSSPSYALQVVDVRTGAVVTHTAADGVMRAAARGLADVLDGFAERPAPRPRPLARQTLVLAGGPPPSQRDGLRIEITEAWAMPDLIGPMPSEAKIPEIEDEGEG